MTQHAMYRVACENCCVPLECPKCKMQQTVGTLFSKWLRKQKGYLESSNFVAHNLDYIWYNHKQFWFITIEEKTNGGVSTKSQNQVHGLIRQMLQFASGHEFDISFGSVQQKAKVEYKGHFIIQFEKTNPEDSKWIKINGKEIDKIGLRALLMFGELPR